MGGRGQTVGRGCEVEEMEETFVTDLSEEEMALLKKLSDAGIRHIRYTGEDPYTVLFAVLSTFHKNKGSVSK
jgi:hypothetical protein